MGTPLKRSRDPQDSDSDSQRPVLNGIKRLRVTSPTSDVDSDMTDEEAATPRSTWRAKAIVPAAPEAGKKRPLVFATDAVDFRWKMPRQKEFLGRNQPIEIPNDANCRAMVVFDPYQSLNLAPSKVELVEDDRQTDTASESDEDNGVRFEELPSDNDEPVDMDVD